MGVPAATWRFSVQLAASVEGAAGGFTVNPKGAIRVGLPARFAPWIVTSEATPRCAPSGVVPFISGGAAKPRAARASPIMMAKPAGLYVTGASPSIRSRAADRHGRGGDKSDTDGGHRRRGG